MDSGVGGLAVLKRLIHHLPSQSYVFMGDTAWMPYGEKPLPIVRDRVMQVHQWLHHSYSIGVFVLACNTATVAAYDTLESLNLPYPILEPVKTTADWVNQSISRGKKLGILATPGTVSGGRYLRFLDSSWDVMQIPCTGLASVVETGICDGPKLEEVLIPYLKPLQQWNAEVVVLGCTHYSLVRDRIQHYLGPQVEIVDSAEVLAQVAIPIIEKLGFTVGSQKMLVTGDGPSFQAALGKLPLEEFRGATVTKVSIEAHSFGLPDCHIEQRGRL